MIIINRNSVNFGSKSNIIISSGLNSSQPNIIGYNEIGGTTDNWNNDQYLGTKFSTTTSFTASTLKAYMADAYGGGFNTFSAAVYSVTSGLPDVLLASSSGASLPNTLGWQPIPISISITSGVEYYLCVWGEVAITIAYDAGDINQTFDRYFVTYNTWDSPFSGTNYNQSSRKYSIFAE